VHGVHPPGGVGEEAGPAEQALVELDESITGPAVAAAEAAGVTAVVSVVDERPAQALVDAADQHDAMVIVVGTWTESPLRGALLGSVAHKLLQLSTRPVLCVPAGPDIDPD
jgi:nucleotide-binding universal stress UspA family protein